MWSRSQKLSERPACGLRWTVLSRSAFLWFLVLWGTLPFVEFVEILAPKRGQALVAAAVRSWER